MAEVHTRQAVTDICLMKALDTFHWWEVADVVYLYFAQGEKTEGCSAAVHSADHLHCLLHTLPHYAGE